MVNPMPASTCWQWRAAVRAPRPAERLRHRRGRGRAVEPGGVEHGLGHLDGDERVGQPVADRLEHARSAGRTGCARGRAHARARASSGDAPTSSWPRASWASATAVSQPVTGCGSASTATAPAVTSTRPSQGSMPSTDRSVELGGAARNDAPRVAASSRRRARSAGRAVAAVPIPATPRRSPSSRPGGRHRRAPATRHRSSAGLARREHTSTTWSSADEATLAAALELEQESTTAARGSIGQRVQPAELGERGVERRTRVRLGRVARGFARRARRSVAVHQRSFPRSSSRRAMMLRWISALPP